MSELLGRRKLAGMAGQHFGGLRNLYQTFGYPLALDVRDYFAAYERQDIAGRIIDAFPSATWREPPEIKADPAFVDAVFALDEKFGLWRTLARADRLAGLGHYGALFVGVDGGEAPALPAEGGNYNLLYLQPHGERTAEVTRWDDDPSSPRYGKPMGYRVTSGTNWTGSGSGQRTLDVHFSRMVHFAEGALEDESIGQPRLERIWNRLMDVDKLLGGSAEIFWQNAAMLMAFIADAESEFDPEDEKKMREQLEEMQHGLRRFLQLRGIDPQSLGATAVADPGTFIESQLDVIAGAIGIPKRILIGSERGELSSTQDENNWAARIAERREQHTTPNILRPLFTRLIRLGVLPAPVNGLYWFEWPEADTLGEEGRAQIAQVKAAALASYLNAAGSSMVIGVEEFRGMLGLDPKQANEELEPEEPLDEGDPQVVAMFARKGK